MTDIQMAGLLRAPHAAVPPQGVPGQADATAVDAIHLGTALHSRSELTSFVTYDKRLLEAARAAGLPVDSPAQQQPAPDTDQNPSLSRKSLALAVGGPGARTTMRV